MKRNLCHLLHKHIFMKKELEMMPQENLLRYTHPYSVISLMRRHAKALSLLRH